MYIERTGDQDRGRAESVDGEAREQRDTFDGWPALAVRLVAFAIALCIVSSLLQGLQAAIQHADGSVEVFAQPEPGEKQDRAREPLENGDDPLAVESIHPEGRMYATEEARRWIGNYSTSTPRIVY